jgi:hypothetical protein
VRSTNVIVDSRARLSVAFNLIQLSVLERGNGHMSKLVTLNDAAQQLGISLAAVRDWRFRRKYLDFVKVGRAVRVLQNSIDKLIEHQTSPALKEQ